MSAPGSGRPRNYEEAAQLSEANARSAPPGAFKTGLQIEADKTRDLQRSNLRFVAAQEEVRAPNGNRRIPDLIVQSPDSRLHMLDVKAGRDMHESADQLQDLTRVKSHGGMEFSSVLLVTGTHSYKTDLDTLQQVHDYSSQQGGLPVRVRSYSMDRNQYLSVPDFRARAEAHARAPASTVPSSAMLVPPVVAPASASSGPRDTSSLQPPTPQFQSGVPVPETKSGAKHVFPSFQAATTSTLSAPQQSPRASTSTDPHAPSAPRQRAPTSHQMLPGIEDKKRKTPAHSHDAFAKPADGAPKRSRSRDELQMAPKSSPAPAGPKLHGSRRAIAMVQAAQKMAEGQKKV